MFSPLQNILRRLERLPMLIALAALVVGIVLADCLRPELWVVAIGFVLGCVAAYFRREMLLLAIVLAGAVTLCLRREAEQLPEGEQLMQLEIISLAHASSSSSDFDARIVALHGVNGWRGSSLDVRVVADVALELEEGERVVANARLYGYDAKSSYGGYMLRVGVVGKIYLDAEAILYRAEGAKPFGVTLRHEALRRLERLGLSRDVEMVVEAMSVGERSTLDRGLRQSYVRSGGAHLLAVSGLHVGFLFVLANMLLLPLTALRHGQLWRSLLIVVVVWFYAMMVGMSPSVTRAATMFSLLQLMVTQARRGKPLNTLCFAAFVMLVWDARMIYDAGFLLSVIAVAAIVEWGIRVRSWFEPSIQGWERFGFWRKVVFCVVRWVLSMAVVSFVASLVTIPLASYIFGEVSLWSVVVGGVMVALSAMAVGVALLWVAMPIAALGGAVSGLLEGVVGLMNSVARWCASTDVLHHQISIGLHTCLLIYLAFLLFTLAVWSLPEEEENYKWKI